MKELIRTNDIVLISWIRSVLTDSCIKSYTLDEQMSVLEGSANAIARRIMVDDEDYNDAVQVLNGAQSEIDGQAFFEK